MFQTYTPQTIKEINPNRDSYTLNYSSPLNPTILPNNKNSLLNSTFNSENYTQRNYIPGFIEAILLLGIFAIGVAVVCAKEYTLPPEAQRILRENERTRETNASSLEKSLEDENSASFASSMYNPGRLREKTEKMDYSRKDCLEELPEILEKYGVKVDEGEEIYECVGSERETKKVNEDPENLESRAESSEKSADVVPQEEECARETEGAEE